MMNEGNFPPPQQDMVLISRKRYEELLAAERKQKDNR